MSKQTAVEWLEEIIECGADLDLIKKCIANAKAMEKEQIIQAYREGRTDQSTRVPKFYNRSSAFYYTSTYNS